MAKEFFNADMEQFIDNRVDWERYFRLTRGQTSGVSEEIDTFKIGSSMVDIGGGRARAEDSVDQAVGFCAHVRVGTAIKLGEALGIAYCRSEQQADKIREKLGSAFSVSNEVPVVKPKLIQAVIGE